MVKQQRKINSTLEGMGQEDAYPGIILSEAMQVREIEAPPVSNNHNYFRARNSDNIKTFFIQKRRERREISGQNKDQRKGEEEDKVREKTINAIHQYVPGFIIGTKCLSKDMKE